MSNFSSSYLGRLRQTVGSRLLLVPGARLVLHDGSRVFLQRRADFGKWSFISGTAEEGEALHDMIVREASEEAGIQITRPVAFGYSDNPQLETRTYPNGDRCQFFAMMFACDTFTGTPRVADNESTDVGWFAFDALPDDCMPAVAVTMNAFHRWRDSGDFQLL